MIRGSRWVLANILGFTAGGAIAGAIARAMGQPHYGVVTSRMTQCLATRTAGVALAVWGTARRSGAVARHPKRGERRVGWWVPATCAGWALAGAVAG